MKFSCEQCQTKYNLPDERVRGKVLKIRCKKCGCQITVSQGGVRTAKGEVEEDSTMIGSRASVGLAGGHGGGGGGDDGGDGGDSTMIGGMADFFAKVGGAQPTPQADEWHLSLDGNVVDPMPLADLAQRIVAEQATPGRDIFVWREGQAEWLPPESINEVRAAVEKARLHPGPVKPAPMPTSKPTLGDEEDEGGDKTQMGSLDFAALGLSDAKAAWEEPAAAAKPEPGKNEPAKSAAKDAAKSEPLKSAAKDTAKSAAQEPIKGALALKSASKDSAKSEPLKSASKDSAKSEPLKSASKDSAKSEPLKSASKDSAKSEPLKSAAKEPLKPALKETPAAKPEADELLEDDAVESVDAIEMDIEMPAPPPKGSRPAPPKPPGMKPPPSFPKPPAAAQPAPAVVSAPVPAPTPDPAPPVATAPVATTTPQLGSEPTIPASSSQAANLLIPGPGEWPQQPAMAQQQTPAPGEWPQEQAPAGGDTGNPYGGGSPYGSGSPYGGTPYGGDPNSLPQGGASPEPVSETPPAKSKTPLFIGIAAVVALLSGASYFLLVKPSTGSQTVVVDAGQDAGAPAKPKEEPVKKPEPPKITGISQAEFDELWSTGESAAKSCFEKAIKKQADLEGKELSVAVEVSDKGKSGEITLSGTDLDDKAKKCILKAMKKWKFPVKDKSAYTAKFPLKISK